MLRRAIFMGLHQMMGSRIHQYYNEFYKVESYTREQLHDLQQKRLTEILEHAVRSVPYYRERVSGNGKVQLQQFPVLTRKEVQDNFHNLMEQNFYKNFRSGDKPAPFGWDYVRTGGTTGEPTELIHDQEMRERGRAGRIYSFEKFGLPFGAPHYKLWPDVVSMDRSFNTLSRSIRNLFSNPIYLNSCFLYEDHLNDYLRQINSSKIDYMFAFVCAAYQLALHARSNNIKMRPLKTIVTTASTLTPQIRSVLQEVFHAQVRNQYGSTECANIAIECDHAKLHILSNNVVLEVVDSEGKPVKNGASGFILVTLLQNFSFPVIRYKIGDFGALSQNPCTCGWPYPVLEKVEGRISEMLTTPEGGLLSPAVVDTLVSDYYYSGLIQRYQLVQHAGNRFVFNFQGKRDIPEETYSQSLELIHQKLGNVLGKNARLEIQRLPDIPVPNNGKFMLTLNKTSSN